MTDPLDIRCLSLWQPWATLVAIGAKQWETRPWPTAYRGWIAIHATKGESLMEAEAMSTCARQPFLSTLVNAGYNNLNDMPMGKIVCLCKLLDCQGTGTVYPVLSQQELAFGNYGPGRFAFQLGSVYRLPDPIPCRGYQQLWFPKDPVLTQLSEIVRTLE